MNIGIIGAGHIAAKIAQTLTGKPKGCACYAVASRDLHRAKDFAGKWNIPVAYGSYEELVADPAIDLVYIATPHSHHYEQARMAIMAGKPCLVEKAFTANAREAEALIILAESQGVFLGEAIWTRYMPLSHKIGEILNSGVIGRPQLLSASLCYYMEHKERIIRPELCGGALLDLGVYVLNFARMYFGTDYERMETSCVLGETGVDMQESISLIYPDGRMANLQSSALCYCDRQGIIRGTEGYLRIDNINCPELVEVYRLNEKVAEYRKPADMITGYEYQFFECARCLREGLTSSPMMPHNETLAVMRQMDTLRKEWGVTFPMD